MKLTAYQKKRNFKLTPEPKGKVAAENLLRKFVIQKHAASHLHYDFRLELGGVLLSWAVPKGPCLDPSVKRLAMHVEDHPLDYGAFEGTIPKGQYGGGIVMLWDAGHWKSLDANPMKAYHAGKMSFELYGKKLHGKWELIRMHNNDKTWLLFKSKDEYARILNKLDITVSEPDSVKTGRTLDEIAKDKKVKKKSNLIGNKALSETSFPSAISPELANLVDKAPRGKKWLHEIKLDGYRILAFIKRGKITLYTRNQHDWTEKFKSVGAALKKLSIKNAIFDGEITVLNEKGYPDFQLLQNAIKNNDKNFVYYIFDLIYFDTYDLASQPLIFRKNYLEALLPKNDEVIKYSEHVIGNGNKIFKEARKLSLEGIISKDMDSTYQQKRTADWLKIKCIQRQEFVIVGYTNPNGKRRYFGSLLLATYSDKNELIYHGNVGTGFTETSLKEIYKRLEKLKTNTMPFSKKPARIARVNWVKPTIVAEVEFFEWTDDKMIRHSSFKGLRADKPAKRVHDEKIKSVKDIHKLKIEEKAFDKKIFNPKIKFTNIDKIIYPEDNITKGELIEYYTFVANKIIPFIINRPLTLLRCTKEYSSCFFQRHSSHAEANMLAIKSIKGKDETKSYIYLKNPKNLLILPQINALEIHTWGSVVSAINYPDMITFDLDPAPDVKWKEVVAAAFKVRDFLASLKITSFVKTTGGKGLHVVFPINPDHEWPTIKMFAKAVVDYLAMQEPKKYINKMSKEERKGKIFLDYLRNEKSATAIAAYSTRARLHAPVATPIEWGELTSNQKDTFFTLRTIPDRLASLKKDPWEDFFEIKQSIIMPD